MDMDDAYAIQKSWMARKAAEGRRVVGYKIGLTSRAMQAAMKIDTPDYDVLLDDMVFANGGDIRADDFTDPRIEVEFAFVLKEPLFGEDATILGFHWAQVTAYHTAKALPCRGRQFAGRDRCLPTR